MKIGLGTDSMEIGLGTDSVRKVFQSNKLLLLLLLIINNKFHGGWSACSVEWLMVKLKPERHLTRLCGGSQKSFLALFHWAQYLGAELA